MMALFSSFCLSNQLVISILFIITIFLRVSGKECYKSIISFGDSLADTGNRVILQQANPPSSAFPSNGETYFNRPTGRYCDGRLVIDFFAQDFGLPLVPPYFGSAGNGSYQKFLKGVNFAVAGATALDSAFLAGKGIKKLETNVSLGVQVGFFKKLLPSLCSSSSACKELFKNSLILMREIGYNDFNYALLSKGITSDVIRGLAPDIVNVISTAIQDLIKLGAVKILVPGIIPLGCQPIFLATFQTSDRQDYDPSTVCLTGLNELTEYYNGMLKRELIKIQSLHPRTSIVYADYNQAKIRFHRSPTRFGFNRTLAVCCGGGGGPHNFNSTVFCGNPGSKSCDDPSSYVSWDGFHLTEAAYRLIFKALLEGSLTIPRCKISYD